MIYINIDSALWLPYLDMLVNAETPCGDVRCVNTKDITMAEFFWSAWTIDDDDVCTSAYSIKYSE